MYKQNIFTVLLYIEIEIIDIINIFLNFELFFLQNKRNIHLKILFIVDATNYSTGQQP